MLAYQRVMMHLWKMVHLWLIYLNLHLKPPEKLWKAMLVSRKTSIYIHLGKFDHDLSDHPHWKSWLIRGNIPKWP